MAIPIKQALKVGFYIFKQKISGRKKYPLVLMLEPLFRCNLECVGCGKIQKPNEILKQNLSLEQCFNAVEDCGAPIVSIAGGEPLMHPEIVEFSNFKYYDNKLSTDYTPSKKSGVAKYLKAFEICNTEGVEQRFGTSYQNLEEANMVINLYNELQDKFEDIVVISPYNAQCNLLRSLEPKLKSCIHSVDSYQGKESDVIILTTVRTENLGFWSDYRRLNVAMTRAKHILRIVGNVNSWEKSDNPLKKLAIYGRKKNIIQN